MPVRDTEILLNLNTGEVRRSLIAPDQRFRFHNGFTESDMEAGWKQIGTFSAGYTETEIATAIKQSKAIYLKQPNS